MPGPAPGLPPDPQLGTVADGTETGSGAGALALTEEGFTAVYHRIGPRIASYLRRLTRDPAAAEDLLQETFYRFLRSGAVPEDERALTSYLFRTATHLATDRWRRGGREEPMAEGWEPAAAPERDRGLSRDLDAALAVLAPRDRALVWLAHVEGADHREIAEILGVGEASVRVMLFRARRRLARVLEDRGLAPREDS